MGGDYQRKKISTYFASLNYFSEIIMIFFDTNKRPTTSWNKGKLTGQKPALKLKEVWAIRIRLELTANVRELALFNMAIDSKTKRVRFGVSQGS